MTQSVPVKRTLPVAAQVDVEAELAKFADAERERLGLEKEEHWLEDMANLSFSKSEKGKIKLLIGGLTMAHDQLIGAAFENLGYNVIALDCPDYDALRVGKEFGNRAQCNPTYFTVGNLVKFLIHLRDEKGMSDKQIVDEYVFLTAGACGPCRFGMYVTEYRKALRDAGFDGFRVMLFQQQGGIEQATGEASGLELNAAFFIGMVKGGIAGDVINGIAYRLRPYEVEAGATDRAIEEAKTICANALREGRSILWALNECRPIFARVKVDRVRLKPKVAIIGEFWAMTTEGDGNYELQRFLEAEGAECDIQFVTAWALYNLWEVRFDTAQRAELRNADDGNRGLKEAGEYGVFRRKIGLWIGDKALRAMFQTFAHCAGFYGYKLPDMDEIAEVAAPYYNNDLRGGEGHMEVGKLIVNVAHNKATMTLSVKPFGCMPSSGVSDGVQSLITERYPGTIFCAVETSGDGAVNFYSRVQMYLFKAKQAVQKEVDKACAETGLTLDQVREYVARTPRLASSLHHPPHRASSTPADVIYEVADLMGTTRARRLLTRGRALLGLARSGAAHALRNAPENARRGAHLGRDLATELVEIARDAAPAVAEKAKARLARVAPFARRSEGEGNLAAAAGG